MRKIALCAVLSLLVASVTFAEGISITFDSDDSRTSLGPRHEVRDARTAITTRDGAVTLLLLKDTIALQLSDTKMADVHPSKPEPGFLEELIVAGVRLAVGKSIEYPLSGVRTVEYRDGSLHVVSTDGKPIFNEVKVDQHEVFSGFAKADAIRVVNAWRAAVTAH